MWIDAGNQEVFIYVEDKQKNIVEERYRFFFVRVCHVSDPLIECCVLFHSRKNGRRSNVNLPFTYDGGGGEEEEENRVLARVRVPQCTCSETHARV